MDDEAKALMESIRKVLHPDLRPYLYAHERLGAMLHHPLVVNVMPHPTFAEYANKQYADKTETLKEARESGDWHTVIFLHERPYRFDALTDAYEHGIADDPKAYWHLVGTIWTDSENIHENFDEWEMLWSEGVTGREAVMDDEEREALAALPDEVTIYRGVGHPDAAEGLSWTTDRDKAIWFARRYKFKSGDYEPYLITAKVARDKILAHFLNRNESEVVVLPRHLNIVNMDAVKPKGEPDDEL